MKAKQGKVMVGAGRVTGRGNGIGAGRVTGKGAMRGKVESVKKGQSHASASSKTTVHVVKNSRG